MVDNTKVIMLMTKKKDLVLFIGLMEENMKVGGRMESNMVWEHILLQVEKQKKVNGKMEKDFIG